MKRLKPISVVLIEDDAFLAETLRSNIVDLGGKCDCFHNVSKAESAFSRVAPKFLIADVAVPLGASKLISAKKARGGFNAGQAFTQIARLRWPGTKCVLITAMPNQDVASWCHENSVEYRLKPIDRAFLEQLLGVRKKRAFVVHGRNQKHVESIKRALSKLSIEPIVLMEQPSKGLTVIEKFEKVSAACDLAVIALSGDDLGKLKGSKSQNSIRARQNVIFELGYFCASLKRLSGKVALVDFGIGEFPSDLAGIVRVDGKCSEKQLTAQLEAELL